MNKYRIKLNGKIYEMEIEIIGQMQDSDDSSFKLSQPHEKMPVLEKNDHMVVSPMPGTVTQLLCRVGDIVKRGQVLIVLEAMKMENEIMATKDGRIREISVKEGSVVSGGSVLIEIGE